MPVYLLGVDIGTQGTKTQLFTQEGKCVASAFEPSKLIAPAPGAMEQSAEDIYQSVIRTVRTVLLSSGVPSGNVAAIGMDGQMAGIMGIDKNFQAVTPYDSWLDTRCEPEIRRMKERMGRRIIEVTGAPVSYTHGAKVLHWKRNFPDAYKQIAKFVLPVTYVAGRMCGLQADSAWLDYTCMHFSCFADVQRLEWSGELMDAFDVSAEKMPRIASPYEIVGRLTAKAAQACGLSEGTPVCAGAGDQAATALGAGIVREGQAFDVAGTASVFAMATRVFAPDVENETILFSRSVIPGLWMPLAYIGGGGLCLRWARDTFAAGNVEVSYDVLAREAQKIEPGCEGLLFIPHFAGRVCPNDPSVRGAYIGLDYRHTRAHMYRAVMEAIGYEYAAYHDILAGSAGSVLKEAYVIGGGSKSDLFNQIKADILNVKYTRLEMADTATWGSAMIAGYAVGLYTDLADEAQKHVEIGNSYLPSQENNAIYRTRISEYNKSLSGIHACYAE